ncbi:hypothetical protein GCM10008967_15190 [Bacillus carboniphilus]|uniref:histidine kinase n=1 Tax=Bacillus carboniphilus TaxID=86663 RepID=A0ABN0W5A1_9BACI
MFISRCLCIIILMFFALLPFQSVSAEESEQIWIYTGSPDEELNTIMESTDWAPLSSENSAGKEKWIKIMLSQTDLVNPYLFQQKSPAYFEVYQNGQEIYQYGKPNTADPRIQNSFRWDLYPVNPEQPVYIKVHGNVPTIQIGSKDTILESMIKKDLVRLLANSGTLMIAFLSLFVFLFNKKQKLSLYFAGSALSLSILGFLRVDTKQLLMDEALVYFYMNMFFSILGPACLILFLSVLFSDNYKKRATLIAKLFMMMGACAVLLVTLWPNALPITIPFLNIFLLITMVTVIGMLARAYFKSRKRALGTAMLGIGLFISFYVFGILLNQKGWNVGIDFGLLANYSLVFACVGIIIRSFMELHKKVENYAVELEKEVKERTDELRDTHHQLLQSVQESATTMLELSALEERNRIAHEIHDLVGHTLTTTVLQLEAAKRLMDKQPEGAKEKLGLSQDLVRKGLDEIRSSVRLLKDADWSFDLKRFLQNLIQETRQHSDVHIQYEIDELPELTTFQKYSIFLALKEGLTNGMKHGQCDLFHFELRYKENRLEFILKNNGKPITNQPHGFGLKSMEERANQLGGTVQKYSEDPWGCVLELTIPL